MRTGWVVWVNDAPFPHLHPQGRQWFRKVYRHSITAQAAAWRVQMRQGYRACIKHTSRLPANKVIGS